MVDYYLVPKSHGKIKIEGIHIQAMGLTSFIKVTPIEIEIMQSLPELDIKLCIPDGVKDSNKVSMLSSEQLTVFLIIKNISNEPLGKFFIESDPDVTSFNSKDLEILQTLKENSEFDLPMVINGYSKSIEVRFSINYSNSEGKVSLNTTFKLEMEITEGISITKTKIEPVFEFP